MSIESGTDSISSKRLDNAELVDSVCQRLGHSGHRGLRCVEVQVDNQRVVLSGTVGSYYLKQVAQETARQACPQHRVHNRLDVTVKNPASKG
ncbi:MAG: BON domain-containing protein [Rubripirellula sp.]